MQRYKLSEKEAKNNEEANQPVGIFNISHPGNQQVACYHNGH